MHSSHYNLRMSTREELHKLIDSMPDGALEVAHRDLLNFQVWPPPPPTPPPDMASMKKRLDEQYLEMKKRMETHDRRPRLIKRFNAGFGSGSYDPTRGSGRSSMSHLDGDTLILQTIHRLQGQDLMVIERIRIEGNHLIYKHEVNGPGDKRDEREIVFDLPQGQAQADIDDHS
jgi:hypothetical protein